MAIQTMITEMKADKLPAESDLTAWLKAQSPDLNWLLAHTYDGVVWGRRDEEDWHLSSDLIDESPPLEREVLEQLRLFGENGELFVWRDDAGLHGRQITDGAGNETLDYMNETQILWGTFGEKLDNQFTRLEDGAQGLVHAVPLEIPPSAFGNSRRPVRLVVRHYITRDQNTGLGRITRSRLVGLRGGKNGS